MPKRYWLVVGTFSISMLLYVDRICISTAEAAITADLGLTDTQFGWVLSAFALGYAVFQTPGGLLADRYGPRAVLASIVSIWSLFTALTGTARGLVSLLAYRFLFGAGEAGAFPSMARTIYSWLPVSERGIAQGINFSGSRIGAAFALPVVALMVEELTWRVAFFVLGAIGIVWALFWWWWFKDTPEEHPGVGATELAHILATRQQDEAAQHKLPLGTMFRSKNMQLAMLQYFCSNFTFFFCLTWLFPYLNRTYGLSTVEAGFYAAAPLLFGALGNWVAGGLVDKIYRDGRWSRSRQLPAIVGFSLAAIGLLGSVYMDSALGAVICLSVAIFGADMTLPPSWSFCIDIGRKHSGAVSGTMNMAGNLGSFVTALAFPYLLFWTGSSTPFFFVGATLNVLAILAWAMMRSEKPVEAW